MDGLPAALPLPPTPATASFVPPSGPPPAAFAPPGMTQPQPASRGAVGRPSADPEQQEARQERHALKQRLKNILPAEMTDGRIAIYRLEGSRGKNKASLKPVMQILFGELEKATSQGGYENPGDYVREKIVEKFGENGRFLWEAQDQKGRTLPEYGEAEINFNTIDKDDTVPDDENLDISREIPAFFERQPAAAAPPPPPFDPAAHAQQVREIMVEEKKGAQDTLALMMTMMQSQTQMQLAQIERQRQEEDRRREAEERRMEREAERERIREEKEAERRREDERRREKEEDTRRERERESRKEMIALALPILQKFLEPKPDTTTPLLFKMLENKGNTDSTKELFTLMGEASRQSMAAQGEATKHLLSAQAEAAKTMIANVMGISQTMVEQMVNSQAEPTDDPMEKVGRIFKMIAPALGALNSGPAAAAPPRIAQAPVMPQQAAQPQAPAQVPPAEYIKGGLYTIMRLSNGEIDIKHRFNALKWCADNLPKPMLDAIRSGVEDSVMEVGAQGMDAKLVGWISEEQNVEFLRDCIKDIQRMLLGTMTQADAKESFEKHAKHLMDKGIQVPGMQAQAQPAAPTAQAVPAEAQMAEPVEEPAPAEGGTGKRRAPPPPPPAAEEPTQAGEN